MTVTPFLRGSSRCRGKSCAAPAWTTAWVQAGASAAPSRSTCKVPMNAARVSPGTACGTRPPFQSLRAPGAHSRGYCRQKKRRSAPLPAQRLPLTWPRTPAPPRPASRQKQQAYAVAVVLEVRVYVAPGGQSWSDAEGSNFEMPEVLMHLSRWRSAPWQILKSQHPIVFTT